MLGELLGKNEGTFDGVDEESYVGGEGL